MIQNKGGKKSKKQWSKQSIKQLSSWKKGTFLLYLFVNQAVSECEACVSMVQENSNRGSIVAIDIT